MKLMREVQTVNEAETFYDRIVRLNGFDITARITGTTNLGFTVNAIIPYAMALKAGIGIESTTAIFDLIPGSKEPAPGSIIKIYAENASPVVGVYRGHNVFHQIDAYQDGPLPDKYSYLVIQLPGERG